MTTLLTKSSVGATF